MLTQNVFFVHILQSWKLKKSPNSKEDRVAARLLAKSRNSEVESGDPLKPNWHEYA